MFNVIPITIYPTTYAVNKDTIMIMSVFKYLSTIVYNMIINALSVFMIICIIIFVVERINLLMKMDSVWIWLILIVNSMIRVIIIANNVMMVIIVIVVVIVVSMVSIIIMGNVLKLVLIIVNSMI